MQRCAGHRMRSHRRAAHLHLDEVEDLLLALGVRDLVQLLGEAAQDGPPAGLVDGGGGAGVRALVHDGVMAGDAQPVVQPAVVAGNAQPVIRPALDSD